MSVVRILVVDDMPLISEGLSLMLAKENNLSIVGKASNGAECMQFLQQQAVDLVLLDHQMPGQSGLEIMHQIRENNKQLKVVMLTFLIDEQLVKNYLEAGANGCLLKHDSPAEFVYGIQQVVAGRQFLSSTVSKVLSKQLVGDSGVKPVPSENLGELTKAEREVLSWIGRGLSVEEIGQIRKTTTSTVSRQKQNIMDKLDIHKEIKLMRFAIEQGLV